MTEKLTLATTAKSAPKEKIKWKLEEMFCSEEHSTLGDV